MFSISDLRRVLHTGKGRQTEFYVPLSTTPYSILASESSLPVTDVRHKPKPDGSVALIDVWLKYETVVLAVSALTLVWMLLQYPPSQISDQTYLRPSSYINLNKTLKYAIPQSQVYSTAQIVMQINTNDPSRSLREDFRAINTTEGEVYPDARHFLVSPKISTVIQLRTVDFGIENCTLMAKTPSFTRSLIPDVKINQDSRLDIWRLATQNEIQRYNPLTWKYTSERDSYIGSVTFSSSSPTIVANFICSSFTFHTFEFACSADQRLDGSSCYVDFWQDRDSVQGVYMVQTTT